MAATRERVVVFDGGMGATLEQFDLTQEDYGGLLGKCHEALVLNRPDVIEGVHASMLEAGAEVVETDSFQGSRLKLEEWGLGDADARDQRQGRADRPQGGRRGALRRRLDRADRLPARLRRPDPRRHLLRPPGRGLRRAGARPGRRRRRPDHHRDRAGHPRGQGGDLRRPRGVRRRPAARCRSRPASRCCPNGGKMLLGTDIRAVLTTLAALDGRRDRAQLLDRAGGHARRDPLPRREQPAAGPLHPQRRPAAAGPRRRDDLPRTAASRWRRRWASSSSATGSGSSAAAAARRPSTSPRSASGSTAACPASARRRGRSRSRR